MLCEPYGGLIGIAVKRLPQTPVRDGKAAGLPSQSKTRLIR